MALRTLERLRSVVSLNRNSHTAKRGIVFFKIGRLAYVQQSAGYKTAVLKEVGKPLVIEDVKTRNKLKDNEVRVNVYTCGVNASDILMCQGQYGAQPKLPFIPGFEICGEVTEVGSKAEIQAGERVIGLNKQHLSGFAEECVINEEDLWVVPQALKFEIGASLIDAYGTALLGLQRRAKVKENDVVLVTAAAGGLGLAAVDLAANVYKAKVIGVCGTEDKASLVRDKGAWAALKYKAKNLHSTVMETTGGKGAQIIFDAVGGEIFDEALKCVAHEGKVIVAGFASRQIPHVPTSLLLPQSFSLIGISLSHYREANNKVYRQLGEDVVEMYEEGLISPHISARFPLDQVNEAINFLQQRKSTGKVILNIR